MQDLASLTLQHFTAVQGATFHAASGVSDLGLWQLVAVRQLGSAYSASGREPFALDFSAPLAVTLEQGTVTLVHESLGILEVFVSQKASPSPQSRAFEAIFT
jgi:hypothetical protein